MDLSPAEVVGFHLSSGYVELTPTGRNTPTPRVVVEILKVRDRRTGRTLYEGRVMDALTKEMLRRRPYLSRSKKPMRRFWRKHVPGEPVPEGLMEEVA